MLRVLALAFVLVAAPAAAQTPTADPELRASVEALCRRWEDAVAKQDSAAVAALFTPDGTFVTPAGVLADRAAVKSFYDGFFKQGWNHEVVKVEAAQPVGSAAIAYGEYSLAGQGTTGALSRTGRWSMTFARESDGWKIRLLTANVAPPAAPSPPPAAPK